MKDSAQLARPALVGPADRAASELAPPSAPTLLPVERGLKAKQTELRHFGLLLGILIVVVFAGIPLLRHHIILRWPWLIAAVLWILALIAPRALGYLHRGWTLLGSGLGWLNTRVILSLLYFLAVLPIGAVMRLAGRDPMRRKFEPEASSYRVQSAARRSNHLEQPY
ncbi:MAG: sxtJ [Deltaproteobacteria bacterium]|nr:sxtJ [Deltaproteobacteria bacterium]